MTRKEALTDLLEKVKAGQPCEIPSPHPYAPSGQTARVMAYTEGYAVMRHKGAMPFILKVTFVVKHLRALIAQEGDQ